MANTVATETPDPVDWLVFPDHAVPPESLDYLDLKDTEVSAASLVSPDNLVLMDLRELWEIWEPLELTVKLDPVVPTEREDDQELLDQPVFEVSMVSPVTMDPQVAWANPDPQDSPELLDLKEKLVPVDPKALSDPKDLVERMVFPDLLVKLEPQDPVVLTDPMERREDVVIPDQLDLLDSPDLEDPLDLLEAPENLDPKELGETPETRVTKDLVVLRDREDLTVTVEHPDPKGPKENAVNAEESDQLDLSAQSEIEVPPESVVSLELMDSPDQRELMENVDPVETVETMEPQAKMDVLDPQESKAKGVSPVLQDLTDVQAPKDHPDLPEMTETLERWDHLVFRELPETKDPQATKVKLDHQENPVKMAKVDQSVNPEIVDQAVLVVFKDLPDLRVSQEREEDPVTLDHQADKDSLDWLDHPEKLVNPVRVDHPDLLVLLDVPEAVVSVVSPETVVNPDLLELLAQLDPSDPLDLMEKEVLQELRVAPVSLVPKE